MKKVIAIAFTMLIYSISGNAQVIDLSYHQSVNAYTNELLSRNIDTICVFEKFDETKNPPYSQYILWKENRKTYLNKFDQKALYPVVKVKYDTLWNVVLVNLQTIKNEIVEPFGYIATAYGKEQPFTTVTEATNVSQFKIYINGDITTGWYNSFDLLEQSIIKNEMRKNTNYAHNRGLKGMQVVNMLDKIISDIE